MDSRSSLYKQVTLCTLVGGRRPIVAPSVIRAPTPAPSMKQDTAESDASATRDLINKIRDVGSSGFTARYTKDLLECTNALENRPTLAHTTDSMPEPPATSLQNSVLSTIQECLGPNPSSTSETMLFNAGLWPSLGPEHLLNQLSLHHRHVLSHDWQHALTRLAEALATRQKSIRLRELSRLGLRAEYRQEIENSGGRGWDMLMYPDWLLIQLDADILIRPVQALVAKEMMAPSSGKNTVMQLNMGDGKSSVSFLVINSTKSNAPLLRSLSPLSRLPLPTATNWFESSS